MKQAVFPGKQNILVLTGILAVLLLLLFLCQNLRQAESQMVMGGQYSVQTAEKVDSRVYANAEDMEKYFRPSKLPALNLRDFGLRFFDPYWEKGPAEIALPEALLKSPEDTVLNYFSILREAANPVAGKGAGCGTLGNAKIPYPVAYNFLTHAYRAKLGYEAYLKSFENILHISLIKLKAIAADEVRPGGSQYFFEIETIEGNEHNQGSFAYYYGFLTLEKEAKAYKISDMVLYGENYLCAPYHGWQYDAELSVDIRYGGWCALIRERYPAQQDGYVKKISFKGTDGHDYMIEFFQLTNGTDIEIAQYKKSPNGDWERIRLAPEKCLE